MSQEQDDPDRDLYCKMCCITMNYNKISLPAARSRSKTTRSSGGTPCGGGNRGVIGRAPGAVFYIIIYSLPTTSLHDTLSFSAALFKFWQSILADDVYFPARDFFLIHKVAEATRCRIAIANITGALTLSLFCTLFFTSHLQTFTEMFIDISYLT